MLRSIDDLPNLLNRIHSAPNPIDEIHRMFIPEIIGRTSTHVWLCFITESGRLYDLDLTAFQFGPSSTNLLPFPCILPIEVDDEYVCHKGMCTRDCLTTITFADFKNMINLVLDNITRGIIEDMVHQPLNGNKSMVPSMIKADFLSKYEVITKKMFESSSIDLSKLPPNDPDWFLNMLNNVLLNSK